MSAPAYPVHACARLACTEPAVREGAGCGEHPDDGCGCTDERTCMDHAECPYCLGPMGGAHAGCVALARAEHGGGE
jgi:hypothetical protein